MALPLRCLRQLRTTSLLADTASARCVSPILMQTRSAASYNQSSGPAPGLNDYKQVRARKQREERSEEARAMERNFTRDYKVGDVYAPHDLSAAEARKWRESKPPTRDAFDMLSLNPLDLYKNFSVMSEYVTEMGRIRPRLKGRTPTGLRPVNQRRLAKAIRRAVAVGLLPSVHRHPELLKMDKQPRKV